MKDVCQNLRPSRALLAGALLLLLALSAGCPTKITLTPPGPGEPTGPAVTAPEAGTIEGDLREAHSLLQASNAAEAEKLFGLLSLRPDLSPEQRVAVLRGLALSSAANRHPFVALGALDSWRQQAPGADADDEWLSVWQTSVRALPALEAGKRADAIVDDPARPWKARAIAAGWSAAILAERRQADQAVALLAELAASASIGETALLENTLLERLAGLSVLGLQNLVHTVTPQNELSFPQRIIVLEQARRMLASNARALPAIETLQRLAEAGAFADPALLRGILSSAVSSPLASDADIALLLPLTGDFADVGWRVVRGVNAAEWELASGGTRLSVHIINANAPGWLARLANLPTGCRIVGGPLQNSQYINARDAGALTGRLCFAFVQRLDGQDEGTRAWRFFTSPDDQIRALMDFAVSLGAGNFGILYPDDGYGRRMSDSFRQAAAGRGLNVSRTAAYPLGQHAEWSGIIRQYLSARMKDKDPIPAAAFQATFLPDDWLNSEMIVPNIFFYNEEKQILLGTNLWEQDLSGRAKVDARNFTLAVFPAAWDPGQSRPSAVNLNLLLADAGLPEPDYWAALGYDFVRFALQLHFPDGSLPDAAQVNQTLASLPDFGWSASPIHWDARGMASCDMPLYTPVSTGYEAVDPEQFAKRLERARTRQAQRLQLIQKP